MLKFVAQYGGACGVAVETAGRRMSMQMEARLKESLEHLRQDRSIAAGKSAGNSGNSHQETLLQQLLTAARTQASRLVKLENICLSNPGPVTPPEAKGEDLQQDVASAEMLVALVTELAKTRAVLELALSRHSNANLPADLPSLPLFFTRVACGQGPLRLQQNLLFSYGTKGTPYEIQLFSVRCYDGGPVALRMEDCCRRMSMMQNGSSPKEAVEHLRGKGEDLQQDVASAEMLVALVVASVRRACGVAVEMLAGDVHADGSSPQESLEHLRQAWSIAALEICRTRNATRGEGGRPAARMWRRQRCCCPGARAGEDEGSVELALSRAQQRHLPAGCETALLFPMRSRRIFSSVTPDLPLSLSSFTVCLWAKPVSVSNRTVLFSYGTKRNPYEIQLLLSGTRALFTVGGEAHLVEGRGVVRGGIWTHICGAWSSEQGIASLWADGHRVAFTRRGGRGPCYPVEAPSSLGQEKNDRWGPLEESVWPVGVRCLGLTEASMQVGVHWEDDGG
nr:uncharacterized protein LOC112074208 [Salvelinus alpinus]